jgi:hypothetical protein
MIDAQPKIRRLDHTQDTDADHIAPLDWQGQAIDCAKCPYHAMLATGKCELGRACVQDRYARRIDRFLRWNPQTANELLNHDYFEVRAIAVRHADVFRLPALIGDPDETVRVALRMDIADLPLMQQDPDYYVRQIVARRLPLALLVTMMHDPMSDVRQEVAQRIEMPALLRMADDKAYEVRRIVAQRLPAALLGALMQDSDLLVRWEVAQRALPDVLQALLSDPDEEIRSAARQRLADMTPDASKDSATGGSHG